MNSSTRQHLRVAAIVACSLLLPALERPAHAQDVAPEWPGLRPGQLPKVWVTNQAGEEVQGRLLSLGPDSLTLLVGEREQVVPRGEIARIQRRDPLRNGAITGALVGAVMGLVSSGMADCPGGSAGSCRSFALALVPLSTAVYAGLGVAIDAATPGRTTIYQAAAGEARSARVQVQGTKLAWIGHVSW